MEPVTGNTNIFPFLFPPLFSLLACVLLPLYSLQGQRQSKESRLFTMLCILALIFNLFLISNIVLPPGNPILRFLRILFPLYAFIIPLSLELAHTKLDIKNRKWIVVSLFMIAVFMSGATWGGRPPLLMWIFFATSLLAVAYALFLLATGYRTRQAKASTLLPWGIIILTLFCAITFLPLPGFMNFPPLSLAFIPLSLVALGMVQAIKSQEKRRRIRGDVVGSIALAFIGLPLVTEFVFLFYHMDAIDIVAFWNWIFPYGSVTFLSFFACISMAIFSLNRSKIQPGSLAFALLCLLWAMNNLQDVLLVIFPEDLAVQAAILNDSYLVILIGLLGHIIYILSGKAKSKQIYIFYGISFTLMPLILFQTQSSHTVYHYPSGPFIKAEGFAYDIFALSLFFVLIYGASMLAKARREASDPNRRHQLAYVMLAVILATLVLLGTFPCMYGIPFYPFQNFAFIPFALIAYGIFYKSIQSLHTRRLIIARLARALLIFGYAIIALLISWVLKEYQWGYIYDRIIPYSIPPLFSFLCAAFLSLFVLGLEQRRPETILFSFLCFFIGGMNLDITLSILVSDPGMALMINRVDHFFLDLFLMGGFLHLIFLVTRRKKNWWVVYFAYAFGAAMAPFAFSKYYFQGVFSYYWGFYARRNFLFDIMTMFWLAGIIVGIVILVLTYRRTDNPNQRATLKYVLYGFCTTAVLSLTSATPMYGYELYPLGTFMFIPLVFLAYGLFKQNLFLALQNVRSLLSFLVRFAFLIAIGLFPQSFLPPDKISLALPIGIFLVVLLNTPVKNSLNAILNLFIKSPAEDLKRQYYALTQGLSRIYHIKAIQEMLSQWFFRVFMSSHNVVLVHNTERDAFEGWVTWNPQYFEGLFTYEQPREKERNVMIKHDHPLFALCKSDMAVTTRETIETWIYENKISPYDELLYQIEIIIPVFLQDRLTSMVLLGGKIDGFPYSVMEREILHDLGPVLGPNIENARLMEDLQMEVERRTEDLNEALIDSLVKEKEITERNEIISRQNEIFRSLLETSTKIHQIWKLDELFFFTLEHMHSLFKDLGFAIILEGARPDILESISFVGISEEEQNIILRIRDRLLDPDIDGIMHEELIRKGHRESDIDKKSALLWTVFPMMLSSQRVIGKMIIKGTLEQSSKEVITVFLGQLSAVTQSKLLMRELEKMASTDGLTGVFNRTYFNQEHLQAIINANKYRIPFSIVMVDVNRLKAVNDMYGHERGDEMIIKVASLLKEVCRKTDVVSRIGGDEFAALMPSTNFMQVENAVRRLRKQEEKLEMACKRMDGKEDIIVPVRISIGVASSDETPPDEVLKEADKRMYLDKERFYEGRERYR